MIVILLVDERCVSLRSYTERSSGDITSENAGMSSENYVRIIMVENLRFLEEGSSAQGMSCKQHYYYVYNAIAYKNRYTLGINEF